MLPSPTPTSTLNTHSGTYLTEYKENRVIHIDTEGQDKYADQQGGQADCGRHAHPGGMLYNEGQSE